VYKLNEQISSFDPCSENYITAYLNIPQVQKALHANVTSLPYPWSKCSDVLTVWNDSPTTLLPTIQELIDSGMLVYIYSGDTDGVIPITVTRYGINKLEAAVQTSWYPWYLQGEVGGYAVGYEGFAFVSIRGAGHYVPSYQPARALAFFSSFLQGTLPPSS
jgi:serine carboxypeptidase-like clade 2